jgi:hypothetical protein
VNRRRDTAEDADGEVSIREEYFMGSVEGDVEYGTNLPDPSPGLKCAVAVSLPRQPEHDLGEATSSLPSKTRCTGGEDVATSSDSFASSRLRATHSRALSGFARSREGAKE